MARSFAEVTALALLLAACGGDDGQGEIPDGPSAFCATSAECGTGNWCNPLGMLCEPRSTTFQFESDIFPMLQGSCTGAGCHIPGVPDPQGTGNISVFSEGPDVAYADLTAGGTNCEAMPHRLCVEEPKNSQAVVRILAHLRPDQTPLMPDRYADPWMQKFLHWIAAGARRSATDIDGGIGVDAPPMVVDAPPPPIDAPPPPIDAPPPPIDAPPPPDAAPGAPGQPVITSPVSGADTGPTAIPVTFIQPANGGSPITQYAITAARVSDGATTTVTCTAPFGSPCTVNGDQTISTTITGLMNCVAYNVTVTATNIAGSTVSNPVTNVTPRQAPSVPTLAGTPVTKIANTVGALNFNWNASSSNGCGTVSYTVQITAPSGFTCGTFPAPPCLNSAGTATDFDLTTTIPTCPYPAVNCNNPREWSFRVRATNAGGTSGFSSSASGSPRIGYTRDTVWTIWNTVLSGGTCVGCHVPGMFQALGLSDAGDPTHMTSYTDITSTPNVVNLVSPSSSLLHLCPINNAACVTEHFGSPHPGGPRYANGSKEDNLVIQWITDGALFE